MVGKSPKKQREISNEELAQMVARGFEESRQDTQYLEQAFSRKIDGLSNRIDNLAFTRATRDEVKSLDGRVKRVEKKLGIKA